jgi:predicted nucleotidyltransferase
MKLRNVLKILRDNSLALNRLGVKSLAIFGSTARNEASHSSDVDILVTFVQSPTFDQYIETKFFLEDLLGCKVDLVMQDGLKPLVRAEVEKEAVYVA